MTEPTSDQSLLSCLLQIDESLRSGQVPRNSLPDLDPEVQRKASFGRTALMLLEASAPRRAKTIPTWAPDRIGRFEILSVLGAGGFAVVYLARDPDLNRQVALKVPRPHSLMNAESRRRFVAEAKTVASLDHPNIISVYESGEDGDIPYLACALCEGPTLLEWLGSCSTSVKPRLAAEIIRTLSVAVAYSHERGILHRDIKPGNVFLFPDSSKAGSDFAFVPRIGDFGLAKLLDGHTADTITSQLIGTPRYLAPEIIRSSSKSATVASDIYSLGATLYTLLVGRPPFESSSTPETLRLIVESDPVAPHVIDPGIDADLSLICLKCLEKQPTQRYDSAAALADDLIRFLSGHPIIARPPSIWRTFAKWTRRRPVIAALALSSAFLTFAVLLLAVVYTRSLQRLQNDLEEANQQLRRSVSQLDKTVRQSEALRQLADENYENAQDLLLAADIQVASIAWKNGDVQGAYRILGKHEALSSKPKEANHYAWNYLWSRVTFPSEKIFNGKQPIWWMQESPFDENILTADGLGTLSAVSRRAPADNIKVVQATNGELGCCAWSDDLRFLVTSGNQGHLAVWNAATRQLLFTLNPHPQVHVEAAVFLPGSYAFLTCGDGSNLILWDAETGKAIRRIPTPHTKAIKHLAMSSDRSLFLTTSLDGEVCLFKTGNDQPVLRIQFDGRPLAMSQFTCDGKRVVVAGRSGALRLCDATNGQIIAKFEGLDAIHTVDCSHNGIVAAGDRSGAILLFDTNAIKADDPPESWTPFGRLCGHQKPISALFWDKKATDRATEVNILFTADRAGEIRRWSIRKQKTIRELCPESLSTDFGPAWLAAGRKENTVVVPQEKEPGFLLVDFNSGSELNGLTAREHFSAVAMCPLTGLVVSGDRQGRLHVSLPQRQETSKVIPVFEGSHVSRLAIDRSGKIAVAQSFADEVAVVRMEDGAILRRLPNQSASTISPDGSLIVTASHGTNLLHGRRIDDLMSAIDMNVHHNTVSVILFSSDGRHLISVSHDRTVCLWDHESLRLRHRMTGHVGKIEAAAISPDCRIVATGDDLGVVKLWDVNVGRELLQIEPLPTGAITGMLFTNDGGTLVVWDRTGHTIAIPGWLPQ